MKWNFRALTTTCKSSYVDEFNGAPVGPFRVQRIHGECEIQVTVNPLIGMSIQLTKVKSVKSYFKINNPVPRGAHWMRVMHFKSVLGYSRHHINLIWMSFFMRKYSLGLVSVWHGSLRYVLSLAMTSFCKDVNFFHQKNFFSKFHILKFNMSTLDVWILFFLVHLSFGKKIWKNRHDPSHIKSTTSPYEI